MPSSPRIIHYPLGSTFETPLRAAGFSPPPVSSPPSHPPIATLDFDATDLSSDCSTELASSTNQLFEVDKLCSSSPSQLLSPATRAAPVKGGLHSYFPIVHTGKRSCDHLELLSQPSPKRAHIKPTPVIPPSGKSKSAPSQRTLSQAGRSAANKQSLNKAVEAGTFRRDEHKWAAFKSKIMVIDPQSEVDNNNPRYARNVLHLKCGKLIRMATVYDTTLYKRHVQTCNSRTAMAGMHTLDNGLNYVSLRQHGSSSAKSSVCNNSTTLWPCPGLSEDDEPRIKTYLLRTTVSSAGGISVNAVAEQMYSSPYNSLTEDQKRTVRAGQVHTHRWSLDHQQRRVFAIGEEHCLRSILYNSGRPQPCSACKALLGNRAFQTAINRDIPEDGNRKFTPLLFQAAEIAKICQKHSGLSTIFDKVSAVDIYSW